MKNCLVMGFGRSGTSLMGGILNEAGYYLGKDLYPPRHSNPKGFFENEIINGINERILNKYDYIKINPGFPVPENKRTPFNPDQGQRWLTYIEENTHIDDIDDTITHEILEVLSCGPFAYKDPRFNYTLDIWNKFLDQEVLFLCMFREPGITIESVIIECESVDYLSNFAINYTIAETLWVNSYIHLLKKFRKCSSNRFIFIHYRQLLSGEILSLLSDKLEVTLSDSFINQDLNRVKKGFETSDKTNQLYRDLCELAKFND